MPEGKTPEVNIAGDYATMKVGDLHFYYGYEHVWCKTHKKFGNRCEDECDTEWAFAVSRDYKTIREFRQSPKLDQFGVEAQLIYGIGQYIAAAAGKGD